MFLWLSLAGPQACEESCAQRAPAAQAVTHSLEFVSAHTQMLFKTKMIPT